MRGRRADRGLSRPCRADRGRSWSRRFEGGFAVRILASAAKRERIVNLLTWLINQKCLGLARSGSTSASCRASAPRSSSCRTATCTTAASSTSRLSGASIACAVKPPIDTVVILGRMRGRSRAPSRSGCGNKIRRASRSRQYRSHPSVKPSSARCFSVNQWFPVGRGHAHKRRAFPRKSRFVPKIAKILAIRGTSR